MKDNTMSGVVPAGSDRCEVLAPVFGRAFAEDPMLRWTLGEVADPAERITRCFACFLKRALTLEIVWETGEGQGAAVWIPPGRAETWDEHPWSQAEIGALMDDGGRRYDTFWSWIDSRIPDEPLWLLDSIAVDPSAQGKGLGTALIADGLARARSAGEGAFLSTGTPRNVPIYKRSGFRVVEERDAPGGGPHIWFMRADP
jgi:GNAT superfamily N-acetyltransferase